MTVEEITEKLRTDERNQSYTLSKTGTLMGGFMVAVWFIVFCVGLAG